MNKTTMTPTLFQLDPPVWRYARDPTETAAGLLPRRQLLVGDAVERLRELPTASVDCCVTSPPYYLLRDYGVDGQLGLEENVEAWAANLLVVLSEVGRVLKPSGSLWLNLGDSYSRAEHYGAPPKSLLLAPERVVLKLVEQGWALRNKVVWAKPNPMPHSVTDRLNTTHEFMYFLVRSQRYHFALDEIREPHRTSRSPSRARPGKYGGTDRAWAGPLAGKNDGLVRAQAEGRSGHLLGRNPGDVWTLATGGYRGAHFATFPERLITRPILAGCPERACQACGTPWKRQVDAQVVGDKRPAGDDLFVRRYPGRWEVVRSLGKLLPACGCQASWVPGVVLDPFFGAGTVGVVAEALKRDWVGIELNPDYARLAVERIEAARAKQERAP
jgi:DNA modification methylase